MSKLSSVQRRLLMEQDDIELDVPDKTERTKPSKPKETEIEEPLKTKAEAKPEVPETPETEEAEIDETESNKRAELLTQAIDELDNMRSTMNKKGLLLAMHLSDFSTQRRLQALADELGSIVNHLNDKMLKVAAKSPVDLRQATSWLSGGGA